MDLQEKYRLVRDQSKEMCNPLSIEDYVPQPIEYVSPPKWNLGHTSWFFEEIILKEFLPDYKVFNTKYSFLFNSYYQALGDRVKRSGRGDLSRPTVDEIYVYRDYVDEHMELLFNTVDITSEISDLIETGLNHEQQHQELFYTDLKYSFSINPLYPSYSDRAFCEEGKGGEHKFIQVEEGLYQIGFDENSFAYDNETPKHQIFLSSFEISNSLVSNNEYLEFIEAGGYENPEYWHDDAWTWLYKNKACAPMYWFNSENEWYQYTLAGLRRIKADAPLTHISYFEAYAFAQWKGMRLPTEFEWEAAADKIKWGDRWEWTESAYLPYPGYKKTAGALGEYNGKFMVNQKVLKGASVVTPKGHERKTYRNFFHPHIGYQFNGIRLAK